MDVGAPSNFVRILEMFEHDFPYLINKLEAASISDDTTAATMREVYAQCNYILDPHGAVGYRALADHIDRHPDQRGIFMETAHPVKFDSVNEILGTKVSVPDAVTDLMAKPKQSTLVGNDYNAVREILLSKI